MFRLLAKEVDATPDYQMVFLLPDSTEGGQEYLNHLGVGVRQIVETDLKSVGIPGTPTIIVANSKGEIMKAWVGKLGGTRAAEVLNSVQVSQEINLESPLELKQALDRREKIAIVDLDDRGAFAKRHLPNARNIPIDELQSRALQELPGRGKLLLYCGCDEDQLSITGVTILREGVGGYENVQVLHGGLKAWQAAGFQTESSLPKKYNHGGPRL